MHFKTKSQIQIENRIGWKKKYRINTRRWVENLLDTRINGILEFLPTIGFELMTLTV